MNDEEKLNEQLKHCLDGVYMLVEEADLTKFNPFDQMILTQIQADLKRHEYEKEILKAKNH